MPEPSRIVEIYMIGYGVNGKWAFQEIVKLCKTNDFIIFRGLAEINPDTRRQAAAEAEAHGINLQIFDHTLDMYQSASLSKNLIMVYDCGPSQLHYSHLIKSAHFGFWHFTEKPPAIKRHDFEKEAEYTKWYCDVLEEENEAVLTAMEYLVKNGLEINSVRVFRESSFGIHQVLGGYVRNAVVGGCLFDKSTHEGYIFELIRRTGETPLKVQVKRACAKYLMISSYSGDEFIDIRGHRAQGLSNETATAQSRFEGKIVTDKKEIPFAFFGGWLGISKQGEALAEKLLADTGYNFLIEKKVHGILTPYVDLRVFELDCGHTKLYGEMKTKKLFVEKDGQVFEMPLLKYEEGQFMRMLKKTINWSLKNEAPNIGNLRLIMGALFDAQEMIEVELPLRAPEHELIRSKNAIEIFCKANKLKPTSSYWQKTPLPENGL